uniref:Uncharacterized protein n=1 Tax=Octopus bimaculoides TaxID=37653 RepID=A0A0L8FUU6_OCTBM
MTISMTQLYHCHLITEKTNLCRIMHKQNNRATHIFRECFKESHQEKQLYHILARRQGGTVKRQLYNHTHNHTQN